MGLQSLRVVLPRVASSGGTVLSLEVARSARGGRASEAYSLPYRQFG